MTLDQTVIDLLVRAPTGVGLDGAAAAAVGVVNIVVTGAVVAFVVWLGRRK